LIYQAHYHKDRQGLMNQTPTMSELQMSMIKKDKDEILRFAQNDTIH